MECQISVLCQPLHQPTYKTKCGLCMNGAWCLALREMKTVALPMRKEAEMSHRANGWWAYMSVNLITSRQHVAEMHAENAAKDAKEEAGRLVRIPSPQRRSPNSVHHWFAFNIISHLPTAVTSLLPPTPPYSRWQHDVCRRLRGPSIYDVHTRGRMWTGRVRHIWTSTQRIEKFTIYE